MQKLRKKDFVLVTDFMMHLKMGKKILLKEYETDSLVEDLNAFLTEWLLLKDSRLEIGKLLIL